MIEYKRKQFEFDVPVKYSCNKCGKEFSDDFAGNQIQSFVIEFGYPSEKDGDQYEFELCEQCLFQIMSDFKYKPKTTHYQ